MCGVERPDCDIPTVCASGRDQRSSLLSAELPLCGGRPTDGPAIGNTLAGPARSGGGGVGAAELNADN